MKHKGSLKALVRNLRTKQNEEIIHIGNSVTFSKGKKARKIQFERRRTLIHGKNHTGKSSLIKSIFWAFGAEPLFNQKFKNASVVVLVRFQIDSVRYSILREGKVFGLFNHNGDLIRKFTSVSKELSPYLGDLFDFQPKYQNKSNEFVIPPPAHLFLPYYVDQDSSWSRSWESFKQLQQIKDYRTQGIFYHSGIRPNDYYSTKEEIQEYVRVIEETDKEQRVSNKILEDISNRLSQTEFNIDVDAFKEEIVELLTQSKLLMRKEEVLKNKLHELYHLKATFEVQINLVKKAMVESNMDLKFATESLPEVIGCPTCGAEYDNSFVERFEIAQDELKSKDLLFELNEDLRTVSLQIEKEYESLTSVSSEVTRIDQILGERKGELEFRDVIDSAGKNQVKTIFKERQKLLRDKLYEAVTKKDSLDKRLKAFEKKERMKSLIFTEQEWHHI